MNTVFITCFTGLISRNILSTDVLDVLRVHPELRIVIVAPESRAGVLKREYAQANVIVAALAATSLTGVTKFWWVLATNLLATGTRRVQRRAKLERDRNRLSYLLSGFVGWLGRSRIVRRLFRLLTLWLPERDAIRDLVSRYRPELIFATDVYTPYDVELMLAGRRRGITTVGMVRSWDNVTSKTLLAFIPDKVAVNTGQVKQELVRYGDVPAASVFITGIPHYERYRAEARTPREEFFRRFALDPRGKLILFTPPSDTYLKSDPIAPVILRALEGIGAQVLVRLALVGKTELGGYRPPAGVALDAPSNSPDFVEVHMDREADRHLADSISHSDLVITWASTMIIDAVLFDKPVVLVGFDAVLRPYGRSIQQYYDYDHQRRILKTGGVRLARSPEELRAFVQAYLTDPGGDAAARNQLRQEYCGPLDGKSGERLAQHLLQALGHAIHPPPPGSHGRKAVVGGSRRGDYDAMIRRGSRMILSGLRLAGRMCAHAATRLEWAWLRRELVADPELFGIFSTFKRSPASKWTVGVDDVVRLYQLTIQQRPEHILEFGTGIGLSTAAMALAVKRLGRGRLTTIEQDSTCLQLARQLIAPPLKSSIRFVRADPEIFQILQISRWLFFCGYAWQPEAGACFDFVLVDGPAGWYEEGELVSLESGEVIRVLPFLAPGGLVYVDGRRSLVKKLKRYLKNYLTLTEQGSEYAIFVRTERPLGALVDLEITDAKLVSPTSPYARP